MNKYAEVFAEQNPFWEEACKICGHKNKFKTIDVFKSEKDYSFICQKCGSQNTMRDIPAAIKGLEKQFKEAGIEVK